MKVMRLLVHLAVVGGFLCSGPGLAAVFASYNVRYDNPGDVQRGDGWKERAPVIAAMIRFHGFDVVGTQEALPHQVKDLRELLPGYGFSGAGREDGEEKGEFIGIFYNETKFRVLESGRFWLSETPEMAGKGWDASLPRICAWAKFEEIESGRKFCFFSVHCDHRGKVARVEGAKLIVRKTREIAGDLPVVLTGDFNVNQSSEAYSILTAGELKDAYETTEFRYAMVGTANRFDPNTRTENRIDHVFLSGHFSVRRYGILTDTYRAPAGVDEGGEVASTQFPAEVKFKDGVAKLPSDHFPVLVETEWAK